MNNYDDEDAPGSPDSVYTREVIPVAKIDPPTTSPTKGMTAQVRSASDFNTQLLQQAAIRRSAAHHHFQEVCAQSAAVQALRKSRAKAALQTFTQAHFAPPRVGERVFVQGMNVRGKWPKCKTVPAKDKAKAYVATRWIVPGLLRRAENRVSKPVDTASVRNSCEEDDSEDEKRDGDGEDELYVPRPTRTRDAMRTLKPIGDV